MLSSLGTGARQLVSIARALGKSPRLVVLDEPTATLSPDQRLRLWGWLDELRGGGMALMFSTQSVDEASRRGDRLVVLGGGRLLFAGTAAAMTAAHGGGAGGPEAAERAFVQLVSGRGEDDAR
jgi:ABC-type multidrug transport system ATPase subunit